MALLGLRAELGRILGHFRTWPDWFGRILGHHDKTATSSNLTSAASRYMTINER